MTLSAGTRLGPYEIVAPLGAGGMGEVYTARDTRLDRTVAVKVLPPDMAANPERVRTARRWCSRAGRLEAARQSARHTIEVASAARKGERAAVWETAAGVWEAWYGHAAAAKRHAMHVLEVAQGRHVSYAAALALAIADDLDRRFPEETSVQFNDVPTLRALSALGANDPSRAIELLRPAATDEFAQPGISFYGSGGGSFGAMYPTYGRGAAYLALHKPAEAAAEFQKILDHPGVVLEDPIGAVAQLQLGRALTQAGDVTKARAEFSALRE